MLSAKGYLSVLGVSALMVIAAVGAVNYVIDPYGTNERFLIAGINDVKSETYNHDRRYKAAVIARRQPDVLALGTSRSERGVSMDHSGWAGRLEQRYNASLTGANIYEVMRYFEHAHQVRPLRQVVLGLDLQSFNAYKQNEVDFEEDLLRREGSDSSLMTQRETAKAYISVSTLVSSWETFKHSRERMTEPFLRDGMENGEIFEEALRHNRGHRDGFIQANKAALTDLNFPPPARKFALEGPDGRSPLEHLARIVAIARRDHIDLRLFISPAHAQSWEALRAAGLWESFETWKVRLTDLLARDAAQHSGEAAIPLWDFSGYNSLTTEHVPAAGDSESRMRWYWEASHYRKEMGDLILDRIFAVSDPARPLPDDFGILLTRGNVQEHLARVRSDRESYRLACPTDVDEVETLAKQTAKATERQPVKVENL